MTKKTNQKKGKTTRKQVKETNPDNDTLMLEIPEGEPKNIPLAEIDISPLNYRKFYSQKALENLAKAIAKRGVIHPVTVRPMPSGRYELVVGERRYRAALIAGLKTIPAIIKVLTDEQVKEIELDENLQREDPHPMHDAYAIGDLRQDKKSFKEIAVRMAKPEQFVYNRLKLLSLIVPFQEMFLADAITMQHALAIAAISGPSQQELFDEHCKNWEQEGFTIKNIGRLIEQFTYDLKKAPFDIKSKTLLPEAGACTQCPFNTATLKSLFPDLSKQAVCQNKQCYHKKSIAQDLLTLSKALAEQSPAALLFDGEPDEYFSKLLDLLPEAGALPRYDRYNVTTVEPPCTPDREEFTYEGDEPPFDESGYEEAMNEYYAELETYNAQLQSGQCITGLYISDEGIEVMLFNTEAPEKYSSRQPVQKMTSKAVQEAIKAKTVTIPMLEGEISRINDREAGLQRNDREKVQLSVHAAFSKLIEDMQNNQAPTTADNIAIRYVLYDSLDYSTRKIADSVLFLSAEDQEEVVLEEMEQERAEQPGEEHETLEEEEKSLYEKLANLTEPQYCFLIRIAVAGNSDSKRPHHNAGAVLYEMAQAAGVNTDAIENAQAEKAEERRIKLSVRITDLERRIRRLKPAA